VSTWYKTWLKTAQPNGDGDGRPLLDDLLPWDDEEGRATDEEREEIESFNREERERLAKRRILRTTLPPGDYYIGDPCYLQALKPDWDNFVSWTDELPREGIFQGRHIVVDSTAYGDGGFPGSDGKTYGVDSGLIAIVELKREEKSRHFSKPFGVQVGQGIFVFGDITINTRGNIE